MTCSLTQWEHDAESLPGGPADPSLDSEPEILAAFRNRLDAWVDGDTGKIITHVRAQFLLGPKPGYPYHAHKCRCYSCEQERREEENEREWRDGE